MIDYNTTYKFDKDFLKGSDDVLLSLSFYANETKNNKEIWYNKYVSKTKGYIWMTKKYVRFKPEKEILFRFESELNEAILFKLWDEMLPNKIYYVSCSIKNLSNITNNMETLEILENHDGMLPPNPIDGHRRWL